MKRINVSNNVIRRLPRYLRRLDELAEKGITRISSSELGQQLGLTPSQIRQDFSCFGEFGQQGYGYNVTALRESISVILGMDREFRAVLIGTGNIGRALMDNFCFSNWGFNLVAAFDVNPEVVGKDINGITVRSMTELKEFLDSNLIDAAVLTVPQEVAVSVSKTLIDNGIRAIWNFTNAEIAPEDGPVIVENIQFADSLLSLSYRIADRQDDEAAKAAKAARKAAENR